MVDQFKEYYKNERFKNPANQKVVDWAKQFDFITYLPETDEYEINLNQYSEFNPFFGSVRFSVHHAIHNGFSIAGFWKDFGIACAYKGMELKGKDIARRLAI